MTENLQLLLMLMSVVGLVVVFWLFFNYLAKRAECDQDKTVLAWELYYKHCERRGLAGCSPDGYFPPDDFPTAALPEGDCPDLLPFTPPDDGEVDYGELPPGGVDLSGDTWKRFPKNPNRDEEAP